MIDWDKFAGGVNEPKDLKGTCPVCGAERRQLCRIDGQRRKGLIHSARRRQE